MKRSLLMAVLAFAVLLPGRQALGDPMMDEPFTWNMVGAEYTDRAFTIPTYDAKGAPITSGASQTVRQHSWSLTVRGSLYSPLNRTALGHIPAIDYDFIIGSISGTTVRNRSNIDGDGGFVFGFKTGYPWALIDTSWFRFGAGFGFGIIYEIGILDPASAGLPGFNLDGFGTLHADFMLPSNLKAHITYEYAPFNIEYAKQYRVNGTVSWGPLGVGLRWAYSPMRPDMHVQNLGAMVGYAF